MRRAFWMLILLLLVAAGAVWMAERPGEFYLRWQGVEIATPHIGLILVALVIVMLLWGWLWYFFMEMRDFPRAFIQGRQFKRREKGYRALSYGMVAVAAGDAEAAARLAKEAEVLLNEPPLTMLLSAQAAQLNGDEQAAETYFRAMEERPETAFLGIRGQLTQALSAGDHARALPLVRRAYREQPRSNWVLRWLLLLEIRAEAWNQALEALGIVKSRGVLTSDEAKSIKAAILYCSADSAETDRLKAKCLKQALKLAPDLTPASLALIALQQQRRKRRSALYYVRKAWLARPHPALAAVWAELNLDTAPLARYKWMKKLKEISYRDGVADHMLARAAMEAELWGEARDHLLQALARGAHRGIYRDLCQLAKADPASASTQELEDWHEGALIGAAEPGWICRTCHHLTPDWHIFCPACEALNSLNWAIPEPGDTPSEVTQYLLDHNKNKTSALTLRASARRG